MNRRFKTHPLSVTEPEPRSASPSSGDDTKSEAPSPKKRKGMMKRAVMIPIVDVDGSKGKGETYPPSDSWAWRKYGQKPIKGSPYPRGYYRCSSSKGCPARKQVERSSVDPTMLVVTYSYNHNHSAPVGKSHSSTAATAAAEAATPSSSSDDIDTSATDSVPRFQPDELKVFANHPDLELTGGAAVLLGHHHHHHQYGELGWLDDVSSTGVLESPICGDVEDSTLTMREEDESLFADLGELPECSAVFRRRHMVRSSAIQCGGIPG